jgi:hypothetical protein
MNEQNSPEFTELPIEPDEMFTREDVERVAKQIWEDEGRPEGKAEEHWRRAQEHLRGHRPKAKAPETI